MFHSQRAKYISKTNSATVFLRFLHCTQGTIHLKATSCHVIVNLLSTVFEIRCVSFATDFTQTRSQKPRTTNRQLFVDSDDSFHPSTCVAYLQKILSRAWILRCSRHIVVNVQHMSQRANLHVSQKHVLPCEQQLDEVLFLRYVAFRSPQTSLKPHLKNHGLQTTNFLGTSIIVFTHQRALHISK